MIHILTGDNSYAIKNRLQKLLKESATSANQPPIENLTLSDLSVLLLGENLFSEKQTVILNNLSQRKDIFYRSSAWKSEPGSGEIQVRMHRFKPRLSCQRTALGTG